MLQACWQEADSAGWPRDLCARYAPHATRARCGVLESSHSLPPLP